MEIEKLNSTSFAEAFETTRGWPGRPYDNNPNHEIIPANASKQLSGWLKVANESSFPLYAWAAYLGDGVMHLHVRCKTPDGNLYFDRDFDLKKSGTSFRFHVKKHFNEKLGKETYQLMLLQGPEALAKGPLGTNLGTMRLPGEPLASPIDFENPTYSSIEPQDSAFLRGWCRVVNNSKYTLHAVSSNPGPGDMLLHLECDTPQGKITAEKHFWLSEGGGQAFLVNVVKKYSPIEQRETYQIVFESPQEKQRGSFKTKMARLSQKA